MIFDVMRYTVVLFAALLLAGVAAGQDLKKPTAADSAVYGNWSKLGPTVEGTRGFTLHSRGIRLNKTGQYELWVKIVPTNSQAFTKRYDLPANTGYVMQHATVDCGKRLLLLEKTALFDTADKVLKGQTSAMQPPSQKAAVKPGSIGESIYKFVCLETTSLPLNENS
jgi:hypothetical protein